MIKANNSKVALIGLLLILFSQAIDAQCYHRLGPAKTKVYFKSNKRIFPRSWRNKSIKPFATSVSPAEEARLRAITETALNKYPKKTISRNLRKVYILKTMQFFGLEYGGTYHKRKVYITDNGIENGYTDEYIEGTFHHEYSSVILKRYYSLFNESAWHEANPKDFAYGDGGLEALKSQQSSLTIDSNLVALGFLNEYSLASLEEDFNCYAQYIFTGSSDFWLAYESNPAVRQKTEILVSFYNKINPIFTLNYFRGLGMPSL